MWEDCGWMKNDLSSHKLSTASLLSSFFTISYYMFMFGHYWNEMYYFTPSEDVHRRFWWRIGSRINSKIPSFIHLRCQARRKHSQKLNRTAHDDSIRVKSVIQRDETSDHFGNIYKRLLFHIYEVIRVMDATTMRETRVSAPLFNSFDVFFFAISLKWRKRMGKRERNGEKELRNLILTA